MSIDVVDWAEDSAEFANEVVAEITDELVGDLNEIGSALAKAGYTISEVAEGFAEFLIATDQETILAEGFLDWLQRMFPTMGDFPIPSGDARYV